MINQNFLSDEEQATCCTVAFNIERSIVICELHQIDRSEVTCCVVQEHVLTARIRCIDVPTVWTGVPPINGGVILNSGVTAVPRTLGHLRQQFFRVVGRCTLIDLSAHPSGLPRFLIPYSFHVIIGHTYG